MSHSALSLPPTTNILSSEQRTRLVRSSRKLGSVLGTTPCLLEDDTAFAMLPIGRPTPRALKRHGSIFTHHQTSSLSIISASTGGSSHHPSSSASSFLLPQTVTPNVQSPELFLANPPGLSSHRRCRTDGPPQLHLQLRPVPVSPTDNRPLLSPSPSPSPCSSLPPSPVTPAPPDDAEPRRKRMAKLARHLGEHVPSELVFASESTLKPPPLSHKGRSRSVHDARVKDKNSSKQEWVGEWNRSNIRDVQKELRNLRAR